MSIGCGPDLVGNNFNGPGCRGGDLCDPSGESDYGGAYRPLGWPARCCPSGDGGQGDGGQCCDGDGPSCSPCCKPGYDPLRFSR